MRWIIDLTYGILAFKKRDWHRSYTYMRPLQFIMLVASLRSSVGLVALFFFLDITFLLLGVSHPITPSKPIATTCWDWFCFRLANFILMQLQSPMRVESLVRNSNSLNLLTGHTPSFVFFLLTASQLYWEYDDDSHRHHNSLVRPDFAPKYITQLFHQVSRNWWSRCLFLIIVLLGMSQPRTCSRRNRATLFCQWLTWGKQRPVQPSRVV